MTLAKVLPIQRRTHAYVAGPMRGRVRYNFDAFEAACTELRARDYTVTSPHEHDLEQGFDPERTLDEQGFDLRAALAWDLGQVLVCDVVVVLPGWATSAGAQAEVHAARAVGTPVLELAEIVEHGGQVAA